jgi:cell wall-associated NlpC family hydrolase
MTLFEPNTNFFFREELQMKKNRYSIILLSIAVLFGLLLYSGTASAHIILTGEDIVNEAIKYEGNRVVMDSAKGVQWIYDKVGIQLPGTLNGLKQEGRPVEKNEKLQLGDILLLGTTFKGIVRADSPEGRQYIYQRLGIDLPGYLDALWAILLVEAEIETQIAAGIYMGDNKFIVSHRPYNTIRVIDLKTSEWKCLGARRIVETERIDIRERVIREGLKYLGTPYEFNSDRKSTETMDCSDFVRRTYYDATGVWIPGNSRTQFAYVQEQGKVIMNRESLGRGDLMFFAEPTTGRINHVAIYMGDDQMLHATSGSGVHVGNVTKYWIERFVGGGNILD